MRFPFVLTTVLIVPLLLLKAPSPSRAQLPAANVCSWTAVTPIPAPHNVAAAVSGTDGRMSTFVGNSTGGCNRMDAYTVPARASPRPAGQPPKPTASPRAPRSTPRPAPNKPTLTLNGVVALNAHGRAQSQFHPGETGFIKVTWTIHRLNRAFTLLTIEQQNLIPNGRGWSQDNDGLVTHPVQAPSGIGSAKFPFFAPKYYRAYRVSVRIRLYRQWSSRRSVTVRVS